MRADVLIPHGVPPLGAVLSIVTSYASAPVEPSSAPVEPSSAPVEPAVAALPAAGVHALALYRILRCFAEPKPGLYAGLMLAGVGVFEAARAARTARKPAAAALTQLPRCSLTHLP